MMRLSRTKRWDVHGLGMGEYRVFDCVFLVAWFERYLSELVDCFGCERLSHASVRSGSLRN